MIRSKQRDLTKAQMMTLPTPRGRLTLNRSLADLTWLRVGGAADAVFQPADRQDLAEFLDEAVGENRAQPCQGDGAKKQTGEPSQQIRVDVIPAHGTSPHVSFDPSNDYRVCLYRSGFAGPLGG